MKKKIFYLMIVLVYIASCFGCSKASKDSPAKGEPIIVTDKVGAGCTFYRETTNEKLGEGSKFPTIQNKDEYITNDYTYTYYENLDGYSGWSAEVNDNSKSSYGKIITSIAGIDVIHCEFDDCKYMVTSPVLPETLKTMRSTFGGCESLKTSPKIPAGVTNMVETFFGCESLTTAPEIPSGVKDMSETFAWCENLVTAPEIPLSVTDMGATFIGCEKLTTAPTIPENVTNLEKTFESCTSLTGTITINASNIESYRMCFRWVKFSSQKLYLTGTSPMLEELKSTQGNQ